VWSKWFPAGSNFLPVPTTTLPHLFTTKCTWNIKWWPVRFFLLGMCRNIPEEISHYKMKMHSNSSTEFLLRVYFMAASKKESEKEHRKAKVMPGRRITYITTQPSICWRWQIGLWRRRGHWTPSLGVSRRPVRGPTAGAAEGRSVGNTFAEMVHEAMRAKEHAPTSELY
jgi:hypothetical protein